MAATLIAGTRGGYSERWEETDAYAFADGASVSIDTQVPARGLDSAAELNFVECALELTSVVGAPLPTAPVVAAYTDTDGRQRLRVTFANNATNEDQNRATWEMAVTLHHSVVR